MGDADHSSLFPPSPNLSRHLVGALVPHKMVWASSAKPSFSRGEYTYLDPLCEAIDRYYDIFSSTRRRRLQVDDSINTPYREGSLPLFP